MYKDEWRPDYIVGLTRGGNIPATIISNWTDITCHALKISFRDDLIIFCKNSIYKLVNINSSSTIAVQPITKNIGCLDGDSIQEIGGQLLFLGPDGV